MIFLMHIYEFIRLHQSNSLREVSELIQNASSGSTSLSLGINEATSHASVSTSLTEEKSNAMQKFQTFSRKFSVSRRGSSASSASLKLQKKNSEELIESYTTSYRNRKGFLTKGWNTVDLVSGATSSEINTNGHEGENIMSYYCESCQPSPEKGVNDGITGSREGGALWCPRIFSPVQMSTTNSSEKDVGKNATPVMVKPEAEYDGGLEEEEVMAEVLPESQQSLCLGRALVYQQDGYVLVVVLPDWSSPDEFHKNLSGNMKGVISETDAHDKIDIFSFGKLLQLNLSAAISSNLDEEDLSAQYLPVPPVPDTSVDIPEGVSFVCCNNLNVAFKAVNVYRSASSPLLAWPTPLAPGCDAILSLLQRETQGFPLSSGQLVGSFQPSVVAALNDVRASILRGHDSPMGSLREACIRVTSAFRGGIWVLGRTMGDRHIIFVLEGCSTLNEVHDVVDRVMTSFLGNILL